MSTAAAFQHHPEPGVFYVKESSSSYPVRLDRLLADGSRISSPENQHLLRTVDYIVSREYAAQPDDALQQGTSISGIVSSFGLLIQWMKNQKLHYFGHLTQWHLEQFLKDCSLGVEQVLDAERRVRKVLGKRGRRFESAGDVLEAAGIQRTYNRVLPKSSAIIEHFLCTGHLPPEEKEPVQTKDQKRKTKNLLWLRAQVFELLWRYREHVPDPLGQQPSAPALEGVVAKHGRDTGSTRLIPTDFACRTLATAFTWLYEYGPLLVDLERTIARREEEEQSLETGVEALACEQFNAIAEARGWSLRLRTDGQEIRGAIRWYIATRKVLPVACYIICGTFTARRQTELLSVKPDAVRGTLETGYWLHSYIAKRAMTANKPCTRSVAEAVMAMGVLMEVRGLDLKNSIFTTFRTSSTRLVSYTNEALHYFSDLVLESTDGPTGDWILASHQLRRLFIIVMRWRYDDPHLLAMSYQLEHTNMKQLAPYKRNAEMQRLFLEEGQRFTLSKLEKVVRGEVTLRGILGKRITKLIAHYMKSVRVTDQKNVTRALTSLIVERGLDLQATLWGFCGVKSTTSNLRRAACVKRQKSGYKHMATVDPEDSREDICAGCLFHGTDDTRQDHWTRKTITIRRSVSAAPEGSIVRRVEEQRLRIVASFTRNSFGIAV
ncbi:MAG TPA: hypothetical protein VHC20_04600 [Candidatus Paceibacterota bacterium]|nr:hypothetical protein [Candidatus Paceibacterota bacterium]